MGRGRPRHRTPVVDEHAFTALSPRLDAPVVCRLEDRRLRPEEAARGLRAYGAEPEPWRDELVRVTPTTTALS